MPAKIQRFFLREVLAAGHLGAEEEERKKADRRVAPPAIGGRRNPVSVPGRPAQFGPGEYVVVSRPAWSLQPSFMLTLSEVFRSAGGLHNRGFCKPREPSTDFEVVYRRTSPNSRWVGGRVRRFCVALTRSDAGIDSEAFHSWVVACHWLVNGKWPVIRFGWVPVKSSHKG